MLKTPLISVIIPCFNIPPEHLKAAVTSALGQTHPNIEVIVVNDGSTQPATLQALAELQRASLVRVLHQPNGGVSKALNAGISAASGCYFIPLNDDIIDPPYLQEALSILESDPQIGIVYCKADFFGAKSGAWHLPAFDIKRQLIDNCIFVTSLFRKEDWTRVGGFDESMRGREDHDFVMKVLGLGRSVHRLSGTYFHYRRPVGVQTVNDQVAADRTALISAYSSIFRNNCELYVRNAESLFEYIFELVDERNDLANRYRMLERIRLGRLGGRLWSAARSIRRHVGRVW